MSATSPPLAHDDDDYHSSEDEDFKPDQQLGPGDDEASSSDSESDAADSKQARKTSKRKIKDATSQNEDLVEDNSGDEAIIRGGNAKRKKVKGASYEEDGGEGGLIKTRAQRAREAKEKVPLSTTKAATVDVDALWKSLNAPSSPKETKPTTSIPGTQSTIQTVTTSRIEPIPTSPSSYKQDELGAHVTTAEAATAIPLPESGGSVLPAEAVESRVETAATIPTEKDGMVSIKRTYEFAGETITEEKQVPANSFEARAYLSSLQTSVTPLAPTAAPAKPLRRPMRKTSKFDPGAGGGTGKKVTKLNSLEKSRLDWAGFVDREGIGGDLDRQRREGGDSYLERQDFLGRVGHRTGDRR